MDDFCKQANIFTNKDDALKYQVEHSKKLHKVYERSLENATKAFPKVESVKDYNVFLEKDQESLKRKEEESKKRKLQSSINVNRAAVKPSLVKLTNQ